MRSCGSSWRRDYCKSRPLRAAVVLRDVQDLSNEEAADALKISVSALKSKLHRGRVLLRKYMEQRVGQRA